jgi:hypothetical protein
VCSQAIRLETEITASVETKTTAVDDVATRDAAPRTKPVGIEPIKASQQSWLSSANETSPSGRRPSSKSAVHPR